MKKYNYIQKRVNALNKNRVYCKCGHSIVITNKYKKVICTWCGHMVFLDKKTEFDYRMNRLLKCKKG